MPKSSQQSIVDDGRFQSIGAGEDAFFSRHDSMGVADGVGGWSHVKGGYQLETREQTGVSSR